MNTLVTQHTKELDYCSSCPKLCNFACPVSLADGRETHTPHGKMTLAYLLATGRLSPTPENVEPLSHCMACRLCTLYCEHRNEVGETLADLRAELTRYVPRNARQEAMAQSYHRFGQAYGEDLMPFLRNLVPKARQVSEATLIYVPTADVVRQRPEEIRAFFDLAETEGLDSIALGESAALCHGLPLWQAGLRDAFMDHVRRLCQSLAGARRIVTPSAALIYVLTHFGEALGFRLRHRVMFVSEFLGAELAERQPPADAPRWLLQEDPYVTRFSGLSKGIRDFAQQHLPLQVDDFAEAGEAAWPICGAGDFRFNHPAQVRWLARRRIEQALALKAEGILCTDPVDAAALSAEAKDGPEILTLTEWTRRSR